MVGWGFEPHSRATLGFLFGCGPRAAAAVSRSGLEGAAAGWRAMEAAAVCPGGFEDRPGCSGHGPRAARVWPKCLDNHNQLEYAFARHRSPSRVVRGLEAVPCINGNG